MPTVLVVEDDEDLVYLYNTTLKQRGYDIVEARSYSEVMKLLKTPDFVPDIVFMDIGMPDAPGTRAIEYMRSESRFANTHVVVITANDQYRERVQEIGGVNYFLVKPITISQLVQVADELVR